MYFRDRAAKQRAEGVPGAIEKMNCAVEISDGAQPARIAKRERRKRKEEQIGDDQANEPFAELERGHRKPRNTRTESEYRWVVH